MATEVNKEANEILDRILRNFEDGKGVNLSFRELELIMITQIGTMIFDQSHKESEPKDTLKEYFINGGGFGWFIVKAENKRIARKAGAVSFGRGGTDEVRRATQTEIDTFISIMGADAIEEIY